MSRPVTQGTRNLLRALTRHPACCGKANEITYQTPEGEVRVNLGTARMLCRLGLTESRRPNGEVREPNDVFPGDALTITAAGREELQRHAKSLGLPPVW